MPSANVDEISANAMRFHREGRFAEAEELCRQALAESPQHYKSLVHLAVLLRHRGEFQESMEVAQSAIEIKPGIVDAYIQLALCLLGTGRPGDSIPVFQRAIKISPKLASLHHNYGIALENMGKIPEAKAALLEACRLTPNDVRARLSLGSILLTEGDIVGAKAQAEVSLLLDSKSGAAHLLLAKILVAQNKGADAEESIRKGLALEPNSSFGHTMLGFRLLQTGDFAGAEEAFVRSYELDPAQGVAYFGITQARKMTEKDQPLIGKMESVLQGTPLVLEQASYLHYGLAKAFDNIGWYREAMRQYDEAHRAAYLYQYGETPFDAAQYAEEIALVKRVFPEGVFDLYARGVESNLPIFIVGMMRSGTTLLEQIISSHPSVGAAGEMEFWAKRSQESLDLHKGRMNTGNAVAMAKLYLRDLQAIAPEATRITDKLPGNYLRLGLIHYALPEAKIIHCRRNPLDTALSVYFTPNPTAPAFSHSREGIVHAYRQYEELMEHWHSVLPHTAIYEVQYEELVSNPELVIRHVLEFLELEWDDACLSPELNAKDVRTPSLWQVRQPIYQTSVSRWKPYEQWLGALAQLA